jgi:gamma-glutamyltranspeptidase/glutathione hydrolase
MSRGHGAVVVTPQQPAADAGAEALRAGGSAVDAAVAAAFALCVVDGANCGLGGYGGFLVYAPPDAMPVTVEFDTWVPRRFPASALRIPGRTSPEETVAGGAAVAPPAVVPGLLTAHRRYGRLPLKELLAPAILLARGGFPIGSSLARALREHWSRTDGNVGDPELRAIFYPDGNPLPEGTTLVQRDLAATLEATARDEEDAFRRGPIAEAICATIDADGGTLDLDDLAHDGVIVREEPDAASFGRATINGPARGVSGTGVVFAALAELDVDRLGANRSRAYVDELARSLAHAWRERVAAASPPSASPHTTTLAAAGADGGLVALTFTHGPWFGSRLVPPGTGIVLNGGANLFAATPDGGRAVTNMSPLIISLPDGVRHVLGGTGGPRIPGMLLSAVVDVVHYARPLAEAIAAPHVSVRADDGRPELEAPLTDLYGPGEVTTIAPPGDFGPANGITQLPDACVAAVDSRFESGVAVA